MRLDGFGVRQEKAKERRGEFLTNSLVRLFANTHPSVEQRIARVRTLYEVLKQSEEC